MARQERKTTPTEFLKAKEMAIGDTVEGILIDASVGVGEWEGRQFQTFELRLRLPDRIVKVSCGGNLRAYVEDIVAGVAPKGILVCIERLPDSYGANNKTYMNFKIMEDPDVTTVAEASGHNEPAETPPAEDEEIAF